MKQESYPKKDGTEGTSYTLEAGDEVIARFDKVGTRDNPVIKDDKAVVIKNHFLGVYWKGKEITVKITDGQKKILDKESDLTDKKIVATEYENDYGKQVGVRVTNANQTLTK